MHKTINKPNLHGFYVKGYKPNPSYKVCEMESQEMSGLWDTIVSAGENVLNKTVANAQTSIADKVKGAISSVTGQVQTTASNIQNVVGQPQQTPPTITTNYVSQPMSNTEKIAIGLGGAFVIMVGILAVTRRNN